MSKSFPEWWKHGQKVRTANDGVLTLNIAEDSEYWLTNNAGKEVSVFSMDIIGPASVPEACSMTTDITELAQLRSELSNPANGSKDHLRKLALLLVEALERKEEQRANWSQMAQKLGEDLDAAEKLIAELESSTVTAAAAAVLAERKRQVAAEGWTPGHDDEYEHGELADAAGCYALSSELFDCAGEPPRPWPWPDEWWKPTNRRRDLVKAGALILAEIERLDRASGIKVEAE